MNISRNNYEAFFIDYLDGNLSDSQIHELEAFLLNNDDLREELGGLEKIILMPEDTKFILKENLKQPDLSDSINDNNFEFYCIAEMEGDLSEMQKRELDEYLQNNPDKKQTQTLLKQTRILPNETIVYNNKSGLKRNVFVLRKIAVYRSLSIAAGIALLLALFFTIIEKDIQNVMVADTESVVETVDTTATNRSQKNKGLNPLKNKTEEKINSATDKIKIKSAGIKFKVGIPIASTDNQKGQIKPIGVSVEKRVVKITQPEIDTRAVTESNILASNVQDKIDPQQINISPSKSLSSSSDFLTVQELAKKKYGELVIKDSERKKGFWNIASAGVNKVSEMAGSEISLNTAQNEKGENKKLSFNSKLLSFSTPINRE